MFGFILIAAIEFHHPLTPEEFVQQKIVDVIQPEIITFVSGLAGIAVFKNLVFRR